jgi:amino acid transporter
MVITKDRFLGIILIIFCGILWFFLIPTYVRGQEQSLFPKMITVWIGAFSIIFLINSVFQPLARKSEEESDKSLERGSTRNSWISGTSLLGLMIGWGFYIFLIPHMGFYPAAFLLLLSSMYFLGVDNWKVLLFRSGLAVLMVYLVFEIGLNLRLPRGPW